MLNQRTSGGLPAVAPSPQEDERSRFVQGLRSLADWLEQTDLPVPSDQRMLLPFHSNTAVEKFAAAHSLEVEYDNEGNASTDLAFGQVRYHVYGYVDFDQHCARADEQRARQWADEHGLVLRPVDEVV
ncbi:hypothetical protein OG729_20145 [Streptomyces sp. NBC_00210]|uniref:hypothetical protein n=1 Tax=Streptomyces sp. NBC_00210 TaxID=2903636 RepID=UPI003251EEDD